MKYVKAHGLAFLSMLLAFSFSGGSHVFGQSPKTAQKTILFGAAYYEEYSPTGSTKMCA